MCWGLMDLPAITSLLPRMSLSHWLTAPLPKPPVTSTALHQLVL